MKPIRALIIALACCLASSLVFADAASDVFDQGFAAYNRQDYDAAFPFFLKAAQMGDGRAQFSVGIFYKTGSGTQQNLEKAREWFRKSAEQGVPLAQAHLGEMLEKGEGGPKDLRQAFFWYDKAYRQNKDEKSSNTGYWGTQRLLEYGDAGSQYVRGIEYRIGSGVPKDEAKARYWFELAAAQGDKDAQAEVNGYKETERRVAAEYRASMAEQQNQAPTSRGPGYWQMQVEADQQKLKQMNAGYGHSQSNTKPWDDNLRCHSTTEAGCR